MRVRVEAALIDDDGSVLLGILREEALVVKEGDATSVPLRAGQRLLDWLDDAKAAVGDQAEAAQHNADRMRGE